MAKVKAKDLKVGDKFKVQQDGIPFEITSIHPALSISFNSPEKWSFAKLYFEEDQEVELVDPPKPEVYTVADIKVGDLVEIEKGSITGIFEVTCVEDEMPPCVVLHLRHAKIVPVVLSVSVLWSKHTKIKKPEPPAIAPWIVECI